MSTHTKLTRKAATRPNYVDPPEFGQLELSENDQVGLNRRKRGGKPGGKGKARKAAVEESEASGVEDDDKPKAKRRCAWKGKGEQEGNEEVIVKTRVERYVEERGQGIEKSVEVHEERVEPKRPDPSRRRLVRSEYVPSPTPPSSSTDRFACAMWKKIKPEALKLAQQAVAAYDAEQEKRDRVKKWSKHRNERIKHLRKRYDDLCELEEHFSLSFPVFSAFLSFESAKPLLLPSKPQDDLDEENVKIPDEEWDKQLPLVLEKVEEHTVNLVLHAIKLILRARIEGELPEDNEILAHLEEYDDEFFEKATSFLCCSHPGCHRATTYTRSSVYPFRYERHDSRPTFVGSFRDLLEHQHTIHSPDEKTYLISDQGRKPSLSSSAPFHLDLPLEVACTVQALIELGDLDDDTAGMKELDSVTKKATLEWEDTSLDIVCRASSKAARAGPDRFLPPPCIVLHPRRW
ncbi:hypothetical protein JCM8547_004367 [Rhodosporidiobolus lusitaniae]